MPKYFSFKVAGYFLYFTSKCIIEAFHVHASDSKLTEESSAKFFVKGNGDTIIQKRGMLTDQELRKIQAFIKEKYREKGIYILNRTSNKGAKDFQNLNIFETIENPKSPLFLAISEKISSYMKEGYSVGAVVGATGLEELKTIASFFTKAVSGGVPLLIPGVGSQGGSAKEVISILKECNYDLSLVRINSSSSLTHPWKSKDIPSNYMEQCLNNIESLLKETQI